MVHLEPIVFTVRVFINGGEYGDPYDAVCTVVRAGDVGYVSGCHGDLNHRVVSELNEALNGLGMTRMEWCRGKPRGQDNGTTD